MKVLVQWASDSPGDYEEIDLNAGNRRNAWRNLPKRPVPKGGERLDEKGYVFDLVIDGIHFYGWDHVAVEPLGGGSVKVYGWTDDVDDDTFAYRWGEVWTLHPHRKDPLVGNQMNTHQIKTVYAEDLDDMGKFFPQVTTGGPVALRPWGEWTMPPEGATRHGIWVKDEALWDRHFERRRVVTWEEW